MVISPYFKSTEVGERPKDPIIEEATISCEKAFSKLERYLHSEEFDAYVIKGLSKDSLGASKSFSGLMHCTKSIGYSSEMLDYRKKIENNLENLTRKVSLYEWLESGFGKFMSCAVITSFAGVLSFYSFRAISLNSGIFACIFLTPTAGLLTSYLTIEKVKKNIITPIVQRSHHAPIRNIVRYSDLFFYDLREKLKSNE